MASVQQRHKSSKVCLMCGKSDSTSINRPHSLHRTKKIIKPNFQSKWGIELCQNCFRTLKKRGVDIKSLAQKK